MKRFIQSDPLLIQRLDIETWSLPVHTHNHFELILIQAGSGQHVVNDNRVGYQPGDVFLLSPSDRHTFIVSNRTSLYSLSFTALYVASLMTSEATLWGHFKEYSTSVAHLLQGDSRKRRTEQQSLLALVDVIWAEQQSPGPLFSNPVVESLMRAILTLLDRELAQYSLEPTLPKTTASGVIQRIAAYICRHITEPDELRMEKLADVFNYSPSHLGALFKQHMGESIQQYIIRYKLRLVETRLSVSTMTISQIADEFGFSDVCHLNKLFKRYYHHTPTSYRRGLCN
ncbi:HTH-type transcriptional activator rhaR AltName: Full=L-rhamnose operon transcriptional activator rhaR [Fibrisoma limi BUZ 3]|uniref:WGS project CAIT00000000 data, contig 6 n=1 Tax=Fibrisoma limi BUZ 3 TaxID=1185876 RepID=I2GI43_9BACT|nr:AraC family transcriptional regulator [Fibrisoma limi]CCH53568.1 HTH-type transcriptional activator rhaR AltName: Full=L-rhamnose operon transcriptional activator rhaR [Fibrisoma limi BUZ 3]